MSGTVLLLEGTRANGTSFSPYLQKRYELSITHTGKAALAHLEAHTTDIVVLDAASMRTSGDRICATLRQMVEATPIIHIKHKQAAREAEQSAADVMLYLPFTYRKLYNRIDRYLSAKVDASTQYGPFYLRSNLLKTPDGEHELTPKLSKLMQVLMLHAGDVVERKQLIKEVWQTEYMGDTRTLDVHIHWLRRAIEKDPKKPRYIKTVRGKGYRLEQNV
ncbi:MAG: winged helix-turn-helix domain-containing protein [Anaerolineales bacterium]